MAETFGNLRIILYLCSANESKGKRKRKGCLPRVKEIGPNTQGDVPFG